MKRTLFFIFGTLLLVSGCTSPKQTQESSASSTSTAKSSSVTKKTDATSSSTSTSQSSKTEPTKTSSTKTQETIKEEVTTNYPYEVPLDTFKTANTFGRRGVNVPNAIEFSFDNANQGTVSFKFILPDQEYVTTYAVSYQQNPTKTVRIFSADSSGIRTVNVNTELVLGERLFSDQDRTITGNLYAFMNKNGGVSLVTPNYAGNVDVNDMDVMLEFLPK